MKNMKLKVDGMTCGSCVRRVERALAQVAEVVVRRMDREGAEVEADDDVEAHDLIAAVRAVGFEATVVAP